MTLIPMIHNICYSTLCCAILIYKQLLFLLYELNVLKRESYLNYLKLYTLISINMVHFPVVLLGLLPAAAQAATMAPLGRREAAIANEYIVRLREDASLFADSSAMKILKEEPRYTYQSALKGFSATMDAQTLLAMRQHPDVC